MRKQSLKKRRAPRILGPWWLRCVLFVAAGVCMGLGAAVAIQWVATLR